MGAGVMTGQPGQSATVSLFPRQHLLNAQDAALYLGMPRRRLRLLVALGGGPRQVRPRGVAPPSRREPPDQYRAAQFEQAGLTAEALAHYRRQRATSVGLDPFMDMASRDELWRLGTWFGSRAVIMAGLVVIVLSHTPLSRLLFHSLK